MAISGEWNYQGGQDRSTFVHEFPLQTPTSGFDVGAPKERNEALTEIIFNRSVFWTNLTHNLALHVRRPLRRHRAVFLSGRLRDPGLPRRAAPPPDVAMARAVRRSGAAALLLHRHTVHVAGRRGLGRQPLFHGGVRGIPVPAAAGLQRRHGRRAVDRRWALRRAAGAQSVRDVLLSRQLRRPRAVQDAAGGADARLRLADQHRRIPRDACGTATTRASAIQDFRSTSSMPTRMARSRTRASG